ncbi:hypothetical protein XENOCAPTIV_008026 [Xenoophorus captivus]|uniref:Uncharacterized protein n=1 Tax=Xenoophorus captivus TaxID=1517983 RepID=A0ABV0QKH7_9TELE
MWSWFKPQKHPGFKKDRIAMQREITMLAFLCGVKQCEGHHRWTFYTLSVQSPTLQALFTARGFHTPGDKSACTFFLWSYTNLLFWGLSTSSPKLDADTGSFCT